MKTSINGLNLIKHYEGLRLTGYDDGVGVMTIGIGHARTLDGEPIRFETHITEDKALEILAKDLITREAAILKLVKIPLKQNQFDALVSLVFNIGEGQDGFAGSTLLKLLNKSDFVGASKQFVRWNKGGGKVMEGLTKRRNCESVLFSTGVLKFI